VREIFTAALLLVGTLFMLVAALGVARMPDLFSRMQASAKAGTLGIACVVAAVGAHFAELGVSIRALVVVLVLVVTSPVSAQAIGWVAYRMGVPLWHGTRREDLRD
jgi:multicomponent Na+:H+ antiporter subunit G